RKLAPSEPRSERRIGRLTFVGTVADGNLAQEVATETGAKVAVWARAGGGGGPVSTEVVLAALAGVSANHVLIVAGENGQLEVIELAGWRRFSSGSDLACMDHPGPHRDSRLAPGLVR